MDAGDCGLHPDEFRPTSEAVSMLPGAGVGGPAHTDACQCRMSGVECPLGMTYGLVKDGVEFMPAAAVKMARSKEGHLHGSAA